MTKKKTKEELVEIREDLMKQQKSLDAKFSRNSSQIKKIEKVETEDFISTIPKDINKISKKQWEWILFHDHREPEGHYKFASDFLQKNFNLFVGGLNPNVKQFHFNLHGHLRKDFFKAFNFLKKYLKEEEQKNKRTGIVTRGIPFTVFGIDDYISPRAYYNKKTRHIKLVSAHLTYDAPKEFKSMQAFEKWYEENHESDI